MNNTLGTLLVVFAGAILLLLMVSMITSSGCRITKITSDPGDTVTIDGKEYRRSKSAP